MPKKILVVEDDKDQRTLYVMTLQFEGFDVDEASDGAIAFKKMQENTYDLLMTDGRMKHMTGFHLIKSILDGELQNIPFILVSAGGRAEEALEIYGSERVLLKPFAPDTLIEKISDLLSEK